MGTEASTLFEFKSDSYRAMRGKSDGEWYCKKCKIEAETEHNKPECHTCADWNGCGTDCKLSRVFCKKCGASMEA
jgi:hypothetical protein